MPTIDGQNNDSSMTKPQFYKPPQQVRSQETLDRILDAAEQVLAEKSFGEATLAEIMERAGVTVGAFYRRYPDKNALLRHLDERFFDEMRARADAALDPARWHGATAKAIIDDFASQAVQVYTARRGLLRSLFLRARTDTVLQESALGVNRHFVARLREVLLARRDELKHSDPERAIELGFMMFIGSLRELIVFGETWPAPPASNPALAVEVARMYCGYLGIS
jgi:AcrR family transcriptional regulator